MKIKLLRNCAGLKFSFSAGEIAAIDNETAKDLIQAGYAEEVKPSAENEITASDAEDADDASEEIAQPDDAEDVKPSGKGDRTTRKRAGNS